MGNLTQNIDAEKKWHEQKFYIDSGHWTSNPVFASRERHWLQNSVQKNRFYGSLYKFIKSKRYKNSAKVLFAPVGNGSDFEYLCGIAVEVYGIDLSPVAIAHCPGVIVKQEGDILKADYKEESFDIIICSQFLHHVHNVGFKPFVAKFHKLLKKGGVLAILEPGAFYPVGWLSALMRFFMGNVTGQVQGERPVIPGLITRELKNIGFTKIKTLGLTFNHVRFPVFFQFLINLLDYPFRHIWPFKLFSCSIGWFCEK